MERNANGIVSDGFSVNVENDGYDVEFVVQSKKGEKRFTNTIFVEDFLQDAGFSIATKEIVYLDGIAFESAIKQYRNHKICFCTGELNSQEQAFKVVIDQKHKVKRYLELLEKIEKVLDKMK